jgi:phospholipid/cholesterol/gamma-HCH transport system substrate-binding protein
MTRTARLGAFIVVTLAILAAGIFIIGSKKYLFSSTYKLNAQFENVAGLAAGADVQVAGVHSGTVLRIDLPHKPGEKVTVVMELAKSTHEIVKQDSLASIETEGMLGNQYVAISFGTAGQADVRNGDTIASIPPLIVADMLKKASAILDTSQVAMQNATEATAHLNSVSAKIDDGQGTIGALVNDKTMYDNLEKTTETMQATMVQAKAGVTDFEEDMEAVKHNFLLSGYFKKRGYEDAADLGENSIEGLPAGTPLKTFTFTAKELFNGRDSAKLKNQKSLEAVGEFLAANKFGVAVVAVSSGVQGDTKADLVLTEARAMVVRAYLADNFEFDNDLLKTLGLGKQAGAASAGDGGSIQILVFPEGTAIPAGTPLPVAGSSTTSADRPAQGTAAKSPHP